MAYRLGVVAFLNSIPLYYTLQEATEIEILPRAPADLTELLESDQVDAALLPIFEYFRGVGGGLIPNVSISSNGPVKSVLLFLKKPIQEVRSIAVDRGSRSSVALLKVLLAERFGIYPNLAARRPEIDSMLSSFDAALIIGDAALQSESMLGAVTAIDLGAEWTSWTGLPFVYAAWVTRQGLTSTDSQALSRILVQARDQGMARLREIAIGQQFVPGLSIEEVIEYLTLNIQTEFSEAHCRGAQEFCRLCVKHGLLGSVRPLRFIA